MPAIFRNAVSLLLALPFLLFALPLSAETAATGIGVVVMHGKGGLPGGLVATLAARLEDAGFRVANLEMPWSGHRNYDVGLDAGEEEVGRTIAALRSNGARQVFVAGHSQGGLFALHYGGRQRVDGIVAIAPGGQVDSGAIAAAVASHVATAREMVAAGHGNDKAEFGDFEGSRGTSPVTTTAAIYLSWFDPGGALGERAFSQVMAGTPVLYVSPERDYPALRRSRQRHFEALPATPHTRLYEPDSDHRNAPTAAADEAIRWMLALAKH